MSNGLKLHLNYPLWMEIMLNFTYLKWSKIAFKLLTMVGENFEFYFYLSQTLYYTLFYFRWLPWALVWKRKRKTIEDTISHSFSWNIQKKDFWRKRMNLQEITGGNTNLQEITGDFLEKLKNTGVYRNTGGLVGLLTGLCVFS